MLFTRIYDVTEETAQLFVPKPFVAKIEQWMNHSEVLVKAMAKQVTFL